MHLTLSSPTLTNTQIIDIKMASDKELESARSTRYQIFKSVTFLYSVSQKQSAYKFTFLTYGKIFKFEITYKEYRLQWENKVKITSIIVSLFTFTIVRLDLYPRFVMSKWLLVYSVIVMRGNRIRKKCVCWNAAPTVVGFGGYVTIILIWSESYEFVIVLLNIGIFLRKYVGKISRTKIILLQLNKF